MELQELILRGRLVLANAPGRQEIFQLVNGRNTAKQISEKINKRVTNTLRDLQKLKDVGLIEVKLDKLGKRLRPDGSAVYQKVPVVRHVPLKYFITPAVKTIATTPQKGASTIAKNKAQRKSWLPNPSDVDILDACKRGEDQIYEFKTSGAEYRKISKEIAGFLNTKSGGIILYGINDDGEIVGSDLTRQKFDQGIQNSIRNMISPAVSIKLHEIKVLNSNVIVIMVPPRKRTEVFYYEGRAYIRKGTNTFVATADEIKKMHGGKDIT